jgi:hypothetical protein
MANTIRDPNREKVWRQTLTRHAKSGLTVLQFAERTPIDQVGRKIKGRRRSSSPSPLVLAAA